MINFSISLIAALLLFFQSGCGSTVTAKGIAQKEESTTVSPNEDDSTSDPPSDEETLPLAVAGSDKNIIAGLAVPLNGSNSELADTYTWEQIAGSPLTIQNANEAESHVQIPSSAADGSIYTFRLTVGNKAGEHSDDVTISVQKATFEVFVQSSANNQLNKGEGMAFTAEGLWVATMEELSVLPTVQGFISLFDSNGTFVKRHTIPGRPVGINLDKDGQLVIANQDNSSIELLDLKTGSVNTLSPTLGSGVSLAFAANYPLPDKDGNIYLSDRTNQKVLRYDASSSTLSVFYDHSASSSNVNALAFGPEADKLYVGTADSVMRLGINPDGTLGNVETYVSGLSPEVDGIVFDEAWNIWIGTVTNETLSIAPYKAVGETAISRSFAAVGTASKFVNLRFGKGAFGEQNLYWSNLAAKTVGKLNVGLSELVPPLAPTTYSDIN